MSINKRTIPPRYDETFKAGAVKMVTEQGRSSKEDVSALMGETKANLILTNSPYMVSFKSSSRRVFQ